MRNPRYPLVCSDYTVSSTSWTGTTYEYFSHSTYLEKQGEWGAFLLGFLGFLGTIFDQVFFFTSKLEPINPTYFPSSDQTIPICAVDVDKQSGGTVILGTYYLQTGFLFLLVFFSSITYSNFEVRKKSQNSTGHRNSNRSDWRCVLNSNLSFST